MGDALTICAYPTISEIDRNAWDACANPEGVPYDPFITHGFLTALEASGSAIPESGWNGCHLIVRSSKQIVGAMPLYVKTHSQGEYVFDHGWADAFERAGGLYYPKLLSAVPFSPVSGRRRLIHTSAPANTKKMLLEYARTFAESQGLSSLHLNFLQQDEWIELGRQGLLLRTDQQFHWHNEGYQSFDDFLEALASRKRKNLRKERATAQAGLEIEWRRGAKITEADWDIFFEFYQNTSTRKWGHPYLTRAFFSHVHAALGDNVLLILAYRAEGHPIAGTLHLIGGDTLYGRYWGASEEHPFLHFELCYYQAIDFAIKHRLARVEAGAQGAHKIARGYVPVPTYSAHHIVHEGLRAAIEHYLQAERAHVEHDINILSQHVPYRRREIS